MAHEMNTPLLCLKINVKRALVGGVKMRLENPPVTENGKILIPTEALTLVGISAEGDYVVLEDVKRLRVVYQGMGLIFLHNTLDIEKFNTERDISTILSLAHSFIFEIDTPRLAKDYAPATEEERREFLRVGTEIREMLENRGNKHPFLLGSQEVFDKLHNIYLGGEGTDEYRYIKALIDEADEYVSRFPALREDGTGLVTPIPDSGYGETEYDVGGRHTHSEGRLTEVMYLAFAYQMTRDVKYAKIAYYYSLEVTERLHWGPGHFLNCSGATGRLAMIYDWLYTAWRELGLDTSLIKKGMYLQGLRHGFDSTVLDSCIFPSPQQGTGWRFKLKADNWTSVCNSGMILGSLCLLNDGTDDVVTDEIYENLTELLGACISSTMDPKLVFTQYAPDGSYVESNSYWAYGTTNLVTSMVALRDSIGTDLGLHHACGFDKTCYYAINSESAEFVGWNYHDGGLGSQNTSCFNPVAFLSGDAQLTALRKSQMDNGKSVTTLDMLYYPTVRGTEVPALAGLPLDYAMEGIDAFTVRDGWERGSLYAGMMGGENPDGGSHNQLDSGAFVYHNLGKMWFTDMGSDYYNSRGIANGEGYFSNYALYRRNAEGNNCLCLESLPFGQLLGGRGEMTEFKSSDTASYCVFDNVSVYGEDKVLRAKRGMLLTNNRKTIVIKDEVEFKGEECAFTTAHFENKNVSAEIMDGGKKCVLTHKDGEKIYVTVLGDGTLELMDCQGLLSGTGPAEGEYSRDDYSRLVIRHRKVKTINTAFVIDTADECGMKENINMEMWKTL